VGVLEAAAAELKTIKDQQAADAAGQQPQGDGTGPVKGLKPGQPTEVDNTYPTDWFPKSAHNARKLKRKNNILA
jgi:hypothetical protein